jgi:alpha-mannosidase
LYKEIFKTGKQCIIEALAALGFDDKGEGHPVALNTLPWARFEMLKSGTEGNDKNYVIASGNGGIMMVDDVNPPPSKSASIKEVEKGVYELSNSRYQIQVTDGVITSLYDKLGKREVIVKGGKANQFVIFDDKPLYWQAWDVEVYHLESRKELKSSRSIVTEQGPHCVSIVTETKISERSWLKSTISLKATTDNEFSSVEIDCEVEWQESMKFLKVEFPVDIMNNRQATDTL